jgi:hypothetical protein
MPIAVREAGGGRTARDREMCEWTETPTVAGCR